MKLLLGRRHENNNAFIRGRTSLNQFLGTSLQYTRQFSKKKKIRQFCQVAIHFHPNHPEPNMSNFCALVGLLLTKMNL